MDARQQEALRMKGLLNRHFLEKVWQSRCYLGCAMGCLLHF